MSDHTNPNENRIAELATIIAHRRIEGKPTHWLEDLSWFARMSGYPVGPLSRYDLDLLDVLDAKEKVLILAQERSPVRGVFAQRRDKRSFELEFASVEENYRKRWREFVGFGYRLDDNTVLCANCHRVCESSLSDFNFGPQQTRKPVCGRIFAHPVACPVSEIAHLIERPAFAPLQICEAYARDGLSATDAAIALAIPTATFCALVERLAGYVPTAGPDSSVLTYIAPQHDLTPADVYCVFREEWSQQRIDRETQAWRGWKQDAKDLLRQAWELARRDMRRWGQDRINKKKQARLFDEQHDVQPPDMNEPPEAKVPILRTPLFSLRNCVLPGPPPASPTDGHQGDEGS